LVSSNSMVLFCRHPMASATTAMNVCIHLMTSNVHDELLSGARTASATRSSSIGGYAGQNTWSSVGSQPTSPTRLKDAGIIGILAVGDLDDLDCLVFNPVDHAIVSYSEAP